MITVFILVIASILLRGAGWLGARWFASWRDAIRVALAIMFLFTGATHFSDMQHDYLAMIPDPLPQGLWAIYLTGVLEIVGAIGLLVPRFRRVAAIGLVILLVAMFPANVNAAVNGIPFRGEPPTSLWLRLLIQILFIGALWWTSIREPYHPPHREQSPQPA